MGSPGTTGLYSTLLDHYFVKIASLEGTTFLDIRDRWSVWKKYRTLSVSFKSICDGSTESLTVIDEDSTQDPMSALGPWSQSTPNCLQLGELPDCVRSESTSETEIVTSKSLNSTSKTLRYLEKGIDSGPCATKYYPPRPKTRERSLSDTQTLSKYSYQDNGSQWLNNGQRVDLATDLNQDYLDRCSRTLQDSTPPPPPPPPPPPLSLPLVDDRSVIENEYKCGLQTKCLRTEINGQSYWFLPDYSLIVRKENDNFIVIGRIAKNRKNIFALSDEDITLCDENCWKYEQPSKADSDNDSDIETEII